MAAPPKSDAAPERYRPLSLGERDTRNRALAQDHDLLPQEYKDWLRRWLELENPSILASSISGLDFTNASSLQPAVRVYHSANQTITTGGTFTQLSFNSERFDQAGGVASTMHDAGDPTKLTCRYPGVYQISGAIEWGSINADNSVRLVAIRVNGSTYIAYVRDFTGAAASTLQQTISTLYALEAGDYVELMVLQTTGGNLDIVAQPSWSPEFMMARVA